MIIFGKLAINNVFNPRLREGGDSAAQLFIGAKIFQSTPPRRRRRRESSVKEGEKCFQSTPPRRRRPPKPTAPECFWRFQSTPPRRRRRSIQSTTSLIVTIFNPRLREGGDLKELSQTAATEFSIHASAKEATATYCNTPAIMCISSLNNFFVHHF